MLGLKLSHLVALPALWFKLSKWRSRAQPLYDAADLEGTELPHAAAANNEGAKDLVKEGLPKDAMGTGASASSGNKRLREDEAGGEGRCVAPQDQDCMLDAQVESHRRGAEKSYEVYHELLAKRSRLAREVLR